MKIQLLYFEGCPHWHVMHDRLREAIASTDSDAQVELVQVRTPRQAAEWRFHGSPSVLVNGRDPFAEPDAPIGLACRLYRTPEGLRGAPGLDELVAALTR